MRRCSFGGVTMHKYIRSALSLLVLLIFVGCSSNKGGSAVESSASSEREVSTELSVNIIVETTESETAKAATETTTEPPVTEPTEASVITDPPATEPPATDLPATEAPVTAAPPTDGVTANGYSITVVDGITYVDGVLIANKTYALPDTYAPGGLTSETYDAFTRMQSAASAEGLHLFVKSGYRSYYDQRYIYNGYAQRDGVATADRYSARAGHSEHQSGMAIDVNSTLNSFAGTPEGIWLKNNCHKYGFIIRYPEDKEHITGYMYEPWHIRYVGEELAVAVTASGLCLEEYFGITSIYG